MSRVRIRAWIRRAWSKVGPMRLDEFVTRLDALAWDGKFREMVDASRKYSRLRRRARRALTAQPPDARALHAAELIAAGWIGAGMFSNAIVHDWMVPLLLRSTEQHLPKMAIARYLVARLARVDDPRGVVNAIETHVKPRSWDDYSNFRAAFSMQTWPILRRCLTEPRLASQLDLFVTEIDRAAFWGEFNNTGAAS